MWPVDRFRGNGPTWVNNDRSRRTIGRTRPKWPQTTNESGANSTDTKSYGPRLEDPGPMLTPIDRRLTNLSKFKPLCVSL